MKTATTIAVGLISMAQSAPAGGIHYAGTEQRLNGAVFYSSFSGEEQLGESFGVSRKDYFPDPVNESFTISVNPYGDSALSMTGHFASSFGPGGFTVDGGATPSITGGLASGDSYSYSGEATAVVRFTVDAPTLIEYALSGHDFASFTREDVFEVIAFVSTNPNHTVTGQTLLEPGEYVMEGGYPFEVVNGQGENGNPPSLVGLSLQIIPAPGAAATLLVAAAVACAGRRRPV